VQLGYSLGWLDLLVSDYRAPGLGGLEVKARPLSQRRGAPLSVALVGGGGFASSADAPVVYGQLVAERELLSRRLAVRAVGTGGLSPVPTESGGVAAGGAVEFRSLPIHSVFAEVSAPLGEEGGLQSPWELGVGAPQQLAIGDAFERAFRL
jgi:hypothetical protein